MGLSLHLEEEFGRLIDLPETQRPEFLQALRLENPELHQRLCDLLQASKEADLIFETPILPDATHPLRALTRVLSALSPGQEPLEPPPVPKRIGDYEILSLLGAGGMGVVYHARQQTPVVREVALKVVRLGRHDQVFLERLASERQALALMNHDHIARIYDAGATDDRRPYFTMEYIPGRPVTEYCRQHQPDPRARIRLFRQVCDAVLHAHARGVIHGDLKPSNILIVDGEKGPVAKVIDFGVARACSQATIELLKHGDGPLIGSPAYMSPEQKLGQLDTRSDIYALGAVLFELITDRVPGEDGPCLSAASAPADLRWIVEKMLQPDPEHRYATVKELDNDLALPGLGTRFSRAGRLVLPAEAMGAASPGACGATGKRHGRVGGGFCGGDHRPGPDRGGPQGHGRRPVAPAEGA